MVEEGKPAPDFALTSDEGEEVTLSSLRGRPIVLYFYPKDDTPGCTLQACDLRDAYTEFRERGAVVLGVGMTRLRTRSSRRNTVFRSRSSPTPITKSASATESG